MLGTPPSRFLVFPVTSGSRCKWKKNVSQASSSHIHAYANTSFLQRQTASCDWKARTAELNSTIVLQSLETLSPVTCALNIIYYAQVSLFSHFTTLSHSSSPVSSFLDNFTTCTTKKFQLCLTLLSSFRQNAVACKYAPLYWIKLSFSLHYPSIIIIHYFSACRSARQSIDSEPICLICSCCSCPRRHKIGRILRHWLWGNWRAHLKGKGIESGKRWERSDRKRGRAPRGRSALQSATCLLH